MQAVRSDEVRIYVVFPAEEYAGLLALARQESRDLRDQVRACVRAEVDRALRGQWMTELARLRRQIVGQAQQLDEVFGEVCVLDDVANALGLSPGERRQMLGERVAAWLDGPVGTPTQSVVYVNGNGHRTALAGILEETRQG